MEFVTSPDDGQIVICGVILCLQQKPEDSLEMLFTANLFPPLFLIPASLSTIMKV
jgi:hypothetical protein